MTTIRMYIENRPRAVMIAVRVLAIASAAAVALIVGRSARIAADTPEHFEQSYAAIMERVTAAGKDRLDDIFLDIVLGETHATQVELDAVSYRPAGLEISSTGAPPETKRQMTRAAFAADRARLVVANAGALVDGRTIPDISWIAGYERRSAIERAIVTYTDTLANTTTALHEAEEEPQAAAGKQERIDSLRKGVADLKSKIDLLDRQLNLLLIYSLRKVVADKIDLLDRQLNWLLIWR